AVMGGEELRARRGNIKRLARLTKGDDLARRHRANERNANERQQQNRCLEVRNGAERQRNRERQRGSDHAQKPPWKLKERKLGNMMPDRQRDRREQKGDADRQGGDYQKRRG